MNNFFQDDNYKMPSTDNYMKFKEGDNTFRVLSSAIVGYQYFTDDNKPVRSKLPFDETPNIKQIKNTKTGEYQDDEVKHFWAFCVWNYADERIQVMELSKKSIMSEMQGYLTDKRWGSPQGYDFTVSRTGSGMATEYKTRANPHSVLENKIAEAWSRSKIDLTELYTGGDPFKPTHKEESTTKPLDTLPEVKVEIGSNGEIADVSQINF